MSKINKRHRYLIRCNSTRSFVSSTNDLGISLPAGYSLTDTIGVDGLGPGIRAFIGAKPHA